MSDTVPNPRNRRLLIGALVVSLAINLFIAGFVAARWLRPIPDRPAWPMAEIARGFEQLPREQREALRRLARDRRQELREKITRLRQAQAEVDRILQAEPFDPRALERSLARIRTLSNDVQREIHDMLLAAAEALPPEARRRLARHHGFRGHHHRPPQ